MGNRHGRLHARVTRRSNGARIPGLPAAARAQFNAAQPPTPRPGRIFRPNTTARKGTKR